MFSSSNPSGNGIYVYDFKKGHNTFVNADYTALTSYTLGSIFAMGREAFSERFHPEDRPGVSTHMEALRHAEDEEVLDIVYRFRRSDGQWIRCHSRDSVFSRGPDGTVSSFIGTFQDITGRNKAEEATRDGEERLRAILNTAADAIITIDRDGIIQDLNPATERIFGYAREEMTGRNVNMLMPSPDREKHDGYLARYHETHEAHIVGTGRQVVARRKDGSAFPVELSISELSKLGLFTGIVRDVSGRKKTERELHSQSEFSERLIETAQIVILMLDLQGRVVYFNPVMEKLSGWTLEAAEGCNWFDTFVPEGDRKRIRKLFETAISGGRTQGKINPVLTKNGEIQLIEWYDAPLTDDEENPTGLLCTGIDVTERQRLQKEVCSAVEEEKLRIAHDLHDGLVSQLTGVSMFAHVLGEKLRKGQSIEAADADMIAQYMHEAAVQARQLSHGLYPVEDQPGALEEALRVLVKRAKPGSKLRYRFERLKDPIEIPDRTSANHLYRIAQEALQNAVKYSGATQLTVRLGKNGDDSVLLTIKDNGCGFDPDKSSARDGIGLHTMKYRASAVGGTLRIETAPGKGTRILCEMPVGGETDR